MAGEFRYLAAAAYKVLLKLLALEAHPSFTSGVPCPLPLVLHERPFVLPLLAYVTLPPLGAVHATP
eukprot:6300516-Pyramimonas_sp.AAC.1